MKVIFCSPNLTMKKYDKANEFFESCREILDMYVTDKLSSCPRWNSGRPLQ